MVAISCYCYTYRTTRNNELNKYSTILNEYTILIDELILTFVHASSDVVIRRDCPNSLKSNKINSPFIQTSKLYINLQSDYTTWRTWNFLNLNILLPLAWLYDMNHGNILLSPVLLLLLVSLGIDLIWHDMKTTLSNKTISSKKKYLPQILNLE